MGQGEELPYDCEGNLESTWDANHPSAGQTAVPTSMYTYDELDRLTEVSQPWHGAGGGFATTSYAYDVQDHMTSVTDAEGNATTYHYSDRDLMTQETSPVSGVTSHQYNDHGEMVEETDAHGITMTRTLDELDRITLVDYPDNTLDITYTYDDPLIPFSTGRLTSIARNGESVDYAYDRFGRITQDGPLSYAHDANGNRTEIGYPGGMKAVYSHDFADRESTLTLQIPGQPDQPVVTASSYEPSGPLTSLTLGNGLTETRGYTSRYFPSTIDLTGPGGALLSWTYATDSEGNILAIADNVSPANNRAFAYQDVQYYLATGNGPWGDLSWTYDQIGNRLTETRDGVTDAYSYVQNAGSGNTAMLQQVQLGIGGFKTFTYGPASHLEEVNAGGNVTNLAYDAASRLSQLLQPATGNKTDFLYDGRSYLSRSEAGSLTGIFRDGFEQGTSECWSQTVTASGTTLGHDCQTLLTQPVYGSDGVLRSLDKVDARNGVDELQHFLYFAGRPVAQVTVPAAGAVEYEWITTDHLGTPVVVSDAAGVVVWSGGFEPFGKEWGGAGTPLRLSDQWEDASWSGNLIPELLYSVYRWLSPIEGRFSRPDPLGVIRPGSLSHLFALSAQNPLVYYDALGLDALTSQERVQDCFYCILQRQGFGAAIYEDSIWITENSGIYDCVLWPPSGKGAFGMWPASIPRPKGYVAFAHTHPTRASGPNRKSPRPSPLDEDSALLARVPVYVVTPEGVFKYDPATDKRTKELATGWHKDPAGRCKQSEFCQSLEGGSR